MRSSTRLGNVLQFLHLLLHASKKQIFAFHTTQAVGVLLKALHQFQNYGGSAGMRSSTQKCLSVIAFSLPSLQELQTTSFYTTQLKYFGFKKVNSKRSGYSHCQAPTELFYIPICPNSAASKWGCDGNSCSLLHSEPLVMAIALPP